MPTLIMTAENDPFVPSHPFRDAVIEGNRNITLVITPEGGHCAFLEHGDNDYDGYWAEREIVRFVTAHETSAVQVKLYPYIETPRRDVRLQPD